MYLHKTPAILKVLYPSLTWAFEQTKENIIYLTFDDGPITGVTEYALEVLNKYEAKATFFCVGENIVKHPAIFEKIISEGHSVGNHTHNHLNGWGTNDFDYLNNVEKCDRTIGGNFREGKKKIFRPPYGRIRRSQAKQIINDYEIIMWSVLTGDFDHRLGEKKCLENTIKYSRNGSIVIFHDSCKAAQKLKFVLPRYLEYFSERGFRFHKI